MVRIAKDIDFKRLEELKKKIDNDNYIEQAIQTLAQELTKSLVDKED
jgi:hypothetical protein